MNNIGVRNPILDALREMMLKDATDPEMRRKYLELKRKRAGEPEKPVVTTVVTNAR